MHGNLSKEDAQKLILSWEQYYLDTLEPLPSGRPSLFYNILINKLKLTGPEYNILKIAGSSLANKYSEEVLAKISQALTGVNNPMYSKIGKDNAMFPEHY